VIGCVANGQAAIVRRHARRLSGLGHHLAG
jgi:hypothetical protein